MIYKYLVSGFLVFYSLTACSAFRDIGFVGVSSHVMHSSFFMPWLAKNRKGGDYWLPENLLGVFQKMPGVVVREPIYEALFFPGEGEPGENRAINGSSFLENRKVFEAYVSGLNQLGVQLLITAFFKEGRNPARTDFADWVSGLANKYEAIRAVELHNEPNLKGFWLEDGFVEVCEKFARRFRVSNTDVRLVVGGFAGFGESTDNDFLKNKISGGGRFKIAEYYFKEGLLQFADGVSIHPYRRGAPQFGVFDHYKFDPDGFHKEFLEFQDLVDKYKPGIPIYITEIGYSVSNKGGSSVKGDRLQAEYLRKMYWLFKFWKSSGVRLSAFFWYDLKDDGIANDPYESGFGLLRYDLSPKKSFFSFLDILNIYESKFTELVDDINICSQDRVFVFSGRATKECLGVFWPSYYPLGIPCSDSYKSRCPKYLVR